MLSNFARLRQVLVALSLVHQACGNEKLLVQKENLLVLDDQMTLFSSPVTLCIYITILLFSDEGASGSYLTIFLTNKLKQHKSSCFMEGSTKCLLHLYIVCIAYKDRVAGLKLEGCFHNLLLVLRFQNSQYCTCTPKI